MITSKLKKKKKIALCSSNTVKLHLIYFRDGKTRERKQNKIKIFLKIKKIDQQQ